MWTLFVFAGEIRRSRPYDCVMVEADDVIHAEKRFKEEIGWSHLTFGYRTFSAATKQEAWDRAITAGLIPKKRTKRTWAKGFAEDLEEEYPTVNHPDHYLNKSPGAKLLPKTQKEPPDSLRCSKCFVWFSWVRPNQPDGSYKCPSCSGLYGI